MKSNMFISMIILAGLIGIKGYSMKNDQINQVQVSVLNYQGWDESVEINNNKIKMVIVPSIGRIMYFGFTGGENILWNNDKFQGQNIEYNDELLSKYFWANYGGDKVWTVEQKDFGKVMNRSWPPDETFDGGKFDFELLKNGVKIISKVSKYSNTRLIREITTEPGSNKFNISQTVICEGKNSKVPVTIWNVSQVLPPEKYVVDWNKESKFDGYLKYFKDKFDTEIKYLDGCMIINNVVNDTVKIGTDSKKFLSAVWHDKIFTQSFHYEENETYPDDGCPVEVFISTEFIEMELLSHLQKLEKDESLSFDIIWTLDELNSADNVKDIINYINEEKLND